MNENKLLYIVVCSYHVLPGDILKVIKSNIDGFDIKCVIVNNSPKSDNLELLELNESNSNSNSNSSHWHYLVGSNTDSEFSAYVEGLHFISEHYGDKHAPILIFNDTAITKHNFKFYIKNTISHYSVINRVKVPAIAGRIDTYNSVCFSNPWSGVNGYISSFIMLINNPAIYAFDKSISDINQYMNENEQILDERCWSSLMPVALREFIISHLIDIDSPIAWYQARSQISNKARLNQKARCVFHEHYISGLLASNGIMVSLFPTWKLRIKNIMFEQMEKIKRFF